MLPDGGCGMGMRLPAGCGMGMRLPAECGMGMRLPTGDVYSVHTLGPCRKHQVFESATLAATNPPVKEQASSKKQQPLRNMGLSPTTTTTTLDGE